MPRKSFLFALGCLNLAIQSGCGKSDKELSVQAQVSVLEIRQIAAEKHCIASAFRDLRAILESLEPRDSDVALVSLRQAGQVADMINITECPAEYQLYFIRAKDGLHEWLASLNRLRAMKERGQLDPVKQVELSEKTEALAARINASTAKLTEIANRYGV